MVFTPWLTYGRFAYDSMKLILARTLWRFEMELEPGSRKSHLADPVSFVSFHQPSLLVNLTRRDVQRYIYLQVVYDCGHTRTYIISICEKYIRYV